MSGIPDVTKGALVFWELVLGNLDVEINPCNLENDGISDFCSNRKAE